MTLPPFQTLVDDHSGAVFGFLCASAGRERAEDLFQETFLSALRAYPRLSNASNLRGWLFRIAARKVIDEYRRRSRRPTPVEVVPEAPVYDGLPDHELWEAVGALPTKQRLAVLHRYLADLPYREIGEALGITEEAARRNVHEGIKKLREVYV